jgi:hypothetical protein
MTAIQCCDCKTRKIMPGRTAPQLCGDCVSKLHRELNQIDRKDDRYTKRGKIKNRLRNIPDEAIPERMALHIEEVADPSIENRSFYKGQLNELKKITQTEIRDIDTEYEQRHEGKYVLKPRYK